jgi:uncharacterized protein YrrD
MQLDLLGYCKELYFVRKTNEISKYKVSGDTLIAFDK